MTASGLSTQFGMAEELYVDEVQTLTGTPSAVFSLIFDGAQTPVGGLATNASAGAIQAALEALPNIGTGNVVCGGGPLPSAVTVTFSGPTVQKRNVPLLVVQTGITGLTPAVTTPGTGYGDAVVVTRFLEYLTESMKLDIKRIESAGLRSGGRMLRTDRWADGRRQAGGDVEVELWSKSQSLLLGQCFGVDGVITTPSGATNTRDHTFTILASDNANRSFTAQLGRPDVNGTVQPFTYKGCKVSEWELSMDSDGLGTLKLSVDAQDEATSIALASASYASTVELLYFSGGQVTIGGANVDVSKVTLSGKMSYKTDRFFLRASTTAGGATLKKEPVANGFLEITGQVEAEFESLALYSRFVAGTLAAITITFQGTIIEAGGGATVNPRYGLTLSMANCRFDGDTPNVKGMDLTELSMPFKVLTDGSTGMSVVYRTTDVAA